VENADVLRMRRDSTVGEVLAFAVASRFLSGRASIWLAAVGLEVAATVVFLVTLPRLPGPLDSLGGQPIAG
jgi:hypothetical protein